MNAKARKITYVLTNESLTVIVDGQSTVVKRSALNFINLRDALLDERWDDALSHLKTGSSLEKWAQGLFTVSGNQIRYDGVDLPQDFNNRIVAMATNGEDPQPLFNFWKKLQLNPSRRSVEQLWRFMNLIGIPLTSDGDFLAYKGVRMDYLDVHSASISNRPGNRVTVQRNKVSDDPQTPCHFGLHVGSLEYAQSFGQRVVICMVNPRDVVCVPYDCSSQKMRVCEYKVIGMHGEGHMPSTLINDNDWKCDEKDPPFDTDYDDWAESDSEGEWDESDCNYQPLGFIEFQEHDDNDEQLDTGGMPQASASTSRPAWILELDAKSESDLLAVNMDDLRRYASKGLKIVGASKISGGKVGLVETIMKVRG